MGSSTIARLPPKGNIKTPEKVSVVAEAVEVPVAEAVPISSSSTSQGADAVPQGNFLYRPGDTFTSNGLVGRTGTGRATRAALVAGAVLAPSLLGGGSSENDPTQLQPLNNGFLDNNNPLAGTLNGNVVGGGPVETFQAPFATQQHLPVPQEQSIPSGPISSEFDSEIARLQETIRQNNAIIAAAKEFTSGLDLGGGIPRGKLDTNALDDGEQAEFSFMKNYGKQI